MVGFVGVRRQHTGRVRQSRAARAPRAGRVARCSRRWAPANRMVGTAPVGASVIGTSARLARQTPAARHTGSAASSQAAVNNATSRASLGSPCHGTGETQFTLGKDTGDAKATLSFL